LKKKKIATIIGARPQIIKSAALTKCILSEYKDRIEEIVIHTGQHYDANLSDVFFEELEIPLPKYNLAIGGKSEGKNPLGEMTNGIRDLLIKENPDVLVIYGDTDSTLAGALAANKLGIPIAHIEAGLRSFDKGMPEEVNRILSDHISTFLFCPTATAVNNLTDEGLHFKKEKPVSTNNPAIYHCGDIMYDNSLYFSKIAETRSKVLEENNLKPQEFVLITVHRAGNTDDAERLRAIFEGLVELAEENSEYAFVLPIHPRTKAAIAAKLSDGLQQAIFSKMKVIPPVSFLDMIRLEQNCKLVITDSGGVQKEAYFFNKNAVILREETEWVEIVENGKAALVDTDKEALKDAFSQFVKLDNEDFPKLFGDGKSARFICEKLLGVDS
jgi:UDP-GlcNAc3NAcA epimerase